MEITTLDPFKEKLYEEFESNSNKLLSEKDNKKNKKKTNKKEKKNTKKEEKRRKKGKKKKKEKKNTRRHHDCDREGVVCGKTVALSGRRTLKTQHPEQKGHPPLFIVFCIR